VAAVVVVAQLLQRLLRLPRLLRLNQQLSLLLGLAINVAPQQKN
jgi:hypothetical protein